MVGSRAMAGGASQSGFESLEKNCINAHGTAKMAAAVALK